MKKKYLFPLLFGVFLLSSCNVGIQSTTIVEKDVIITEADEVEVIQIKNSISDVYSEASKSCVGIYVTTEGGAGSGSGVIYKKVDNTYYVVTNNHVVEDTTSVKVFDGKSLYYTATVLGRDSKNDIAVITFTTDVIGEAREFIPVDIFKDPKDIVTIGQTTLAIGCPLSLTENYNALAVGNVASISEQKIVTDCAVNPGNSGGGLFNMEGSLIGIINSKKVWTTQTENGVTEKIPVEGRSNAISLEIVKTCVKDIEELGGTIERPIFGIYVTCVNTLLGGENYEKYKDCLPQGEGMYSYVVVTSLNEVSAAKDCGLQVEDVLLKINGNPITVNQDISDCLVKAKMTDTITLNVYRKSENKVMDIAIKFQ